MNSVSLHVMIIYPKPLVVAVERLVTEPGEEVDGEDFNEAKLRVS